MHADIYAAHNSPVEEISFLAAMRPSARPFSSPQKYEGKT
uniref:Uncharacterized protein n=1 Tax=Manihot esculenta TaxID=3983 RepID=A0A2C9UP36_MANES